MLRCHSQRVAYNISVKATLCCYFIVSFSWMLFISSLIVLRKDFYYLSGKVGKLLSIKIFLI